MTDPGIPAQLVTYSRRAYERRLMGGTGGNFSARVDADTMLITATGVSLGDTTTDNLVSIDIRDGTWASPLGLEPSKEYQFHLEIMRLRDDVGAVLHGHPPYATAFAVLERDIPMVTDAAFKQPPMPRVAFAPSGSEELRDLVAQAIRENPGCKALLLEEHGIAALGADVTAAFNTADLTEELARIALLAELLSRGT